MLVKSFLMLSPRLYKESSMSQLSLHPPKLGLQDAPGSLHPEDLGEQGLGSENLHPAPCKGAGEDGPNVLVPSVECEHHGEQHGLMPTVQLRR